MSKEGNENKERKRRVKEERKDEIIRKGNDAMRKKERDRELKEEKTEILYPRKGVKIRRKKSR